MTELVHPDRLAKVARLRAEGCDPYPARGVDARSVAELRERAGSPEAPGPLIGEVVTAAGRLLGLRDMGKLVFAPLVDRSGRIQLGLSRDRMSAWWPSRKLLDGGDLVGATGELGFTQKGELTIWANELVLLAKALAPPPEKWHGLADKELRYRARYVDLWATEGVREVFVQRSKILSLTRRFLEARGFLEVETPTLHPIYGGAAARPFVTHHNALDMQLYLRIAPELYLKRLIVGGLERVFEVARNFRNEGLSTRHNPEFTMLELYQAQADYRHMMALTEELFEHLARELHGTSQVTWREKRFDLAAPWPRERYGELFARHNGCAMHDEQAVRARAKALGLEPSAEHWTLVGALFDRTVEPELGGPVFVIDYPIAICPLAKASPEDPTLAERFEVYVDGMELGNAFSELNDPVEQERRFAAQVASKDPEAPSQVDVDYVQALEYGMPPCGGLGIGIDRLCMLLTGQDSIRDVLLFPAMRPQQGDAARVPTE